MCAIIGFTRRAIPRALAEEGFSRTLSRGPDMSRFAECGGGWLGFHRLAIMGLSPEGMQPFSLDGDMCVCNGEIYGFRPIKAGLVGRGYQFESGSDCEILLPLYREFGTELFRMLDAEFACIIYDSRLDRFIAARDPLGIRPLYYGELPGGGMAFASEAKNLLGICPRILPFPPGHYWDGGFHRYAGLTTVKEYSLDGEEAASRHIRGLLIQAVNKRLDSDAPLGFLLSGGLDSSLVCSIASRLLQRPIRTFAIGMDTDPIDLGYARLCAGFLGSEHTEVIMTREDALGALDRLIYLLGTYDITTVRASIGMYLVCKYIHEHTDVRVLLTGEISDELFGYKYTDFAPSPGEFQRECKKRIDEVHMYDVLRADRCISSNSLEARVPFGDLSFVRYVMGLDPALKMNRHGIGKYLLRRAFDGGGWLPPELLWRQKAAFSDAVGHSMVDALKAYAEGLYTDAEFESRRMAYDFARPFTKESLLYREIFEKYYPGQARMIPGFWMPNPSWPGCAVSDPSARALSNYGGSGDAMPEPRRLAV